MKNCQMSLQLESNQPVAWLDLSPLKSRAGGDNTATMETLGRSVLTSVLRDANIATGFVSPGGDARPAVLLFSATSQFDILQMHRALGAQNQKQRHAGSSFLVGGPGMTNPYALTGIADYCYLGRAEDEIADICGALLSGASPQSASLVDLVACNSAQYRQASCLSPTQVRLPPPRKVWRETFVGCPHQCAYCHYAFARRYLANDPGEYEQAHGGSISREIRIDKLSAFEGEVPRRLLTSIDGCSERLRYAVGKRISNAAICDGLRVAYERGCSVVDVYNIGSYPSETDEDRRELVDTLEKAVCVRVKKRPKMYVRLQTTPFQPSPLTPMAIFEANLAFDWRGLVNRKVAESEAIVISHSSSIEGTKSLLARLLVDRANGSSASQQAIAVAASKKYWTASNADALNMINDRERARVCRRFSWHDLPTRIWTSWVPQSSIERRSERIERALFS